MCAPSTNARSLNQKRFKQVLYNKQYHPFKNHIHETDQHLDILVPNLKYFEMTAIMQ